MEYRKLGNSGLELPVISFGAWVTGGWMWGGADDKKSVRAISRALEEGISCIDTAPIYGMGHSEHIVGKAIAGKRDKVIVATKCGLRWDLEEGERFFETTDNAGRPCTIYKNLRPHSIEYECEASLNRLGTDYIDLYQCHWSDSTTAVDDTIAALIKLQDQGKIRAFGVSNFSAGLTQKALACGPVVSNQLKYNALERDIEAEVLPFCKKHGVGVLAYSPIAQGLLTGKVTADRKFAAGDARRNKALFSKANREKINACLEELQPLADLHCCSLGQLFIAWLIAQPGVTSALVGARTEEQVLENAQAAGVHLSRKELGAMREAVERLQDQLAL